MHDISVQDLAGRLHVEQHVELDERLTLKDAHDQVTDLEADMRRDVPDIAEILTHIGDAHRAARDLRGARDTWREALAILHDLDHPDASQVRDRLRDLDATSSSPETGT